MEIDRYLEIQRLCNKDTYAFIRETKISPENYKLNEFFEYIIAKRNITYIDFKFSSKIIVGHYMRDEAGKSIMLNSSHSRITQKLGKVHEIGHDTLHVNSDVTQDFQDGLSNLYSKTEDIEIEANTAAMMYYIPDISLYSAISDPYMNYEKMMFHFNVPDWLLERRIIRFLQINCMMTFNEADDVVRNYQGKGYYKTNSILQEMVKIEMFENKLITEFTDPLYFDDREKSKGFHFETRSLFRF
ncbi:ImmA/IrrE family metallo-endopeptidase [Enterococcus sp. AZ109]|uniref:ImmA/IrrE family metallo-endopeptidase n=1 Tax=Enterococcus sp. AZ109 TaxID=2774634 RepID=UPI003F262937